MEAKKVLYLITKATRGGAQKYLYDLVTRLPEEYEAVVLYGQRGRLAEDLQDAHIATREIPTLARNVALISDIRSFVAICTCLRSERPDVVHLNSSKAAALGALAARLCGVRRIVFTVHGWPFGERRSSISRIVIWIISWFTALLSHRVICVSDYDLRLAERMPLIARKAVRIYNGITPLQLGSGQIIRDAFPAGVAITGTVGELTPNKNQIALIERAKAEPNLYVAIVGDGELRDFLEKKAVAYGVADRVKFFGYMPVRDVLKGFDAFALPSLKEGLPYVLLEARAAGIPITANRVGGVGEVLDKPLDAFSLDRMVAETIALY
ncbi:MAG TPA: glycosyltransferase [Candidatus Paceibacterota bacterium]|jgi:glycosyltransferase involved in cell wall biosynthesis|nr:glycosyltransferase [Candidatus Paceibacterota bacterium]